MTDVKLDRAQPELVNITEIGSITIDLKSIAESLKTLVQLELEKKQKLIRINNLARELADQEDKVSAARERMNKPTGSINERMMREEVYKIAIARVRELKLLMI